MSVEQPLACNWAFVFRLIINATSGHLCLFNIFRLSWETSLWHISNRYLAWSRISNLCYLLNLIIIYISQVHKQLVHTESTAHILQKGKNHQALRKEIWPLPTTLQEKLYGPVDTLQKTTRKTNAQLQARGRSTLISQYEFCSLLKILLWLWSALFTKIPHWQNNSKVK
jgi:hypothetical protein